MVFFRIALRNLLRNKRRTLLTLCTMVFGLATLALVKGYANAVRRVQLESTVYGTTGMIQIHAKGYRRNVLANPISIHFEDSLQLREKVLGVKGVKAVAGRLVVSGLLSLPQGSLNLPQGSLNLPQESFNLPQESELEPPSTPLTLIAIEPQNEKMVSPELFRWIDKGEMLQEDFAPGIVLGSALAHSLFRKTPPSLGHSNKNTTSEGDHPDWPAILANDVDGNLNGVPVSLVGTLSAVLPGDKRFGYMTLSKARELLRMESKLTSFIVTLEDIEKVHKVKQELEQTLGPQFEVFTWDELAPYVKDILQNVDLIFLMVTLIFIMVIGLGVANALLMTVMERKTEIGTILAVGGTRTQIATFFTIEGFFLGIFGALAGTLLGILVVAIFHETGIKLSAPGSDVKIILRTFITLDYVVVSFFCTIVLSSLVSLWPALRASSLKPIEALQNS